MPSTTTLSSTGFYKTRQGYDRITTHEVNGIKVRITMHRDSYDFQSRFYAEAFSPTTLSWNRIASVPGETMSDLVSPYAPNQDMMAESLDEVEEILMAEVMSLLA